MPHLDEGTLHALLDGELETAEVKEIQTHLGACAACGSRLQDVKQFLAEADRLVEALAMPGGSPKAGREPAPSPEVSPSTPSHARPPREPVWDSAPELLLPEDPEEEIRRRRWNSRFRWAAMILIFLGAGQVVKSIFSGSSELPMDERDMISSAPQSPPPVVSPEEQVRAEPPLAKQSRPVAPAGRSRALKPTPEPKVLADQPVSDTPATDQFDTLVMAVRTDTAPSPPPEVGAAAARADADEAARRDPSADVATRQAAAAALEELDRERLRSRANAATAALPPPRQEEPPVATVEPAARTLEQKSQIYLRIGLDEAAQQLGRPMHVIEAMSPEFVGLAQGRKVAGADPNRPVVRVVYRDSRGRMILLDQQRLRTGQAPGAASGNLRWTLGDVMLYLHGEPGPESLRTLQRRVR